MGSCVRKAVSSPCATMLPSGRAHRCVSSYDTKWCISRGKLLLKSRGVRQGCTHFFKLKFVPFGSDLFGGQLALSALHPPEMLPPQIKDSRHVSNGGL